MKRAYKIIALLAISAMVLLSALAYAIGLIGFERYSGYFAPAWDRAGKAVYFIQRDTFGAVWGMGWEHFSPPASSYTFTDEFSLRRVDAASGDIEVLQTWTGSPVTGRITKHYRGRIFNTLWARVDPDGDAAKFVLRMNIPRVPSSETWFLGGTWRPGEPAKVEWDNQWRSHVGSAETVLVNNLELMAVRGPEGFPAAIITIAADGNHRVLVQSDAFEGTYPNGVPSKYIAERSRRASIERVRTLTATRAGFIAKHKAAGLSDVQAALKSIDDLEELGLLPKSPRLVAKGISSAKGNLRVFDIPPDYFTVGLFTDIADAIANPGTEVATGSGSYLKYYDDEVGPQLRKYRSAGNDRFIVRTGGKLYVLEVRRFKWTPPE